MIEFTETSRTTEAKQGDYFYKLVINKIQGKESVAIFRTKIKNKITGFGSYSVPPAVQTVNKEGQWVTILDNEILRFKSVKKAMTFIPQE